MDVSVLMSYAIIWYGKLAMLHNHTEILITVDYYHKIKLKKKMYKLEI